MTIYLSKKTTLFQTLACLLCLAVFAANHAVAAEDATRICIPVGYWVAPREKTSEILVMTEFMTALAKQPVVLLGETHDSVEHHRWQLQTIAGLYAQRADMTLGFEMFPRRVQSTLDRWVAGKLSAAQFLEQSEWNTVWNYDAAIYLPIFHFARMNRIPMLALNVDRELTAKVNEQGWDNVPKEMKDGISKPAPASQAYLETLAAVFQAHGSHKTGASVTTAKDKDFDFSDPGFRRFVEGQLTWDGAMAQSISRVAQQADAPMIVAIMGSGHIMNRFGVPHQLKNLGVEKSSVLLPWDSSQGCEELTPDLADAVFGIDPPQESVIDKPRLGLLLEDTEKGVRVIEVTEDSIAETTGLRAQDLLTEIAGLEVNNRDDIIHSVQRQAPPAAGCP